MLGIVSY